MSTHYLQSALSGVLIPTCPSCFLGMGGQEAGQPEVEMKVVQVGAATKDGRHLLGYAAICPACRLTVPMLPIEWPGRRFG